MSTISSSNVGLHTLGHFNDYALQLDVAARALTLSASPYADILGNVAKSSAALTFEKSDLTRFEKYALEFDAAAKALTLSTSPYADILGNVAKSSAALTFDNPGLMRLERHVTEMDAAAKALTLSVSPCADILGNVAKLSAALTFEKSDLTRFEKYALEIDAAAKALTLSTSPYADILGNVAKFSEALQFEDSTLSVLNSTAKRISQFAENSGNTDSIANFAKSSEAMAFDNGYGDLVHRVAQETARTTPLFPQRTFERPRVGDVVLGEAMFRFEVVEALEPALAVMWVGALNALTSDNPDWVRHMASSVRELMTHVLHRISPDRLILRWVARSDYLHASRPTRRARLHFALSPASEKLNDHQEGIIREYLDVTDQLHELTHMVAPRVSYADAVELLHMVRRIISELVLQRRPS